MTLTDYKTFLGISSSDEDGLIETISDEVVASVKQYLGRDLDSASYVEIYDGDGTPFLATLQYPITSVDTLEVYDGENWDTWTEGDEYVRIVIRPNGESIYLDGNVFEKGIQNIRLSYDAGYSTVPLPIQRVYKELVYLYYGEFKKDQSLGVESVTKGNPGFTKRYKITAVEDVLKSIETYRLVNV